MIGLRTHRLRGNLVLLLLGALATAVILLPLVGLLVRAPWSDWPRYLADPIVRPAIRLSLVTTAATVATTDGSRPTSGNPGLRSSSCSISEGFAGQRDFWWLPSTICCHARMAEAKLVSLTTNLT